MNEASDRRKQPGSEKSKRRLLPLRRRTTERDKTPRSEVRREGVRERGGAWGGSERERGGAWGGGAVKVGISDFKVCGTFMLTLLVDCVLAPFLRR